MYSRDEKIPVSTMDDALPIPRFAFAALVHQIPHLFNNGDGIFDVAEIAPLPQSVERGANFLSLIHIESGATEDEQRHEQDRLGGAIGRVAGEQAQILETFFDGAMEGLAGPGRLNSTLQVDPRALSIEEAGVVTWRADGVDTSPVAESVVDGEGFVEDVRIEPVDTTLFSS